MTKIVKYLNHKLHVHQVMSYTKECVIQVHIIGITALVLRGIIRNLDHTTSKSVSKDVTKNGKIYLIPLILR